MSSGNTEGLNQMVETKMPVVISLTKLINALGAIRGRFGIKKGFGLQNTLNCINTRVKAREPLPLDFRCELINVFGSDMLKIEKITGRNLDH